MANDKNELAPAEQESLMGHIEVGIPKLITANNKAIVYVIGPKGEGKSTLINYLLGSLMGQRTDELHKNKVDTLDAGYASIGHSQSTAHTLYPQAYEYGPTIIYPRTILDYKISFNQWRVYSNLGALLFIYNPDSKKWETVLSKPAPVFRDKKPDFTPQEKGLFLYQDDNQQYQCLFYSSVKKRYIKESVKSMSISDTDLMQMTGFYDHNPMKDYDRKVLPDNSPLLTELNTINADNVSDFNKTELIRLLGSFKIYCLHLMESDPPKDEKDKVLSGSQVLAIRIPDKEYKVTLLSGKTVPQLRQMKNELKNAKDSKQVYVALCGVAYIINHENMLVNPDEENNLEALLENIQDYNNVPRDVLYQITNIVFMILEYAMNYKIGYKRNQDYVEIELDKMEDEELIQMLSQKDHKEIVTLKNNPILHCKIKEKIVACHGAHYPILQFDTNQYQYYGNEAIPPIVYCDCPGLNDNRGNAAKIWAYVSMEWAAKTAKKIQAIFAVISYGSLSGQRGDALKNSLSQVLKLFKPEPYIVKILEPLYDDIKFVMGEITGAQKKSVIFENVLFLIKNQTSYRIAFQDKNKRYRECEVNTTQYPIITTCIKQEDLNEQVKREIYIWVHKNGGTLNKNIYLLTLEADKWKLQYYKDYFSTPLTIPLKTSLEAKLETISYPIHYLQPKKNPSDYQDDILHGKGLVYQKNEAMNNQGIAGKLFFKKDEKIVWVDSDIGTEMTKGVLGLSLFKKIHDLILKYGGSPPNVKYVNSLMPITELKKELEDIIEQHEQKRSEQQMGSIRLMITKTENHPEFEDLNPAKRNKKIYDTLQDWILANQSNDKERSESQKTDPVVLFCKNLLSGSYLHLVERAKLNDKNVQEAIKNGHILLIKEENRQYSLGYTDQSGKFLNDNITIREILSQISGLDYSNFELYIPNHSLEILINKRLQQLRSQTMLRRQFTVVNVFDAGEQCREISTLTANCQEFSLERFNFEDYNKDRRERFFSATYRKLGEAYYSLSRVLQLTEQLKLLQDSKSLSKSEQISKMQAENKNLLTNQDDLIKVLQRMDNPYVCYDDHYELRYGWYLAKSIFTLSAYYWYCRAMGDYGSYTFEYTKGPYNQVMQELRHGKLKIEVNDSEQGKFKAHFRVDAIDNSHDHFARVRLISREKDLPANRAYLKTLLRIKRELECIPAHLKVKFISGNDSDLTEAQKEQVTQWKEIYIQDKGDCFCIYFFNMKFTHIIINKTISHCLLIDSPNKGEPSDEHKRTVLSGQAVLIIKADGNYYLGFKNKLDSYQQVQLSNRQITDFLACLEFENRYYTEDQLDAALNYIIWRHQGKSIINTLFSNFLKALNDDRIIAPTIISADHDALLNALNSILRSKGAFSLTNYYDAHRQSSDDFWSREVTDREELIRKIDINFHDIYFIKCLIEHLGILDDTSKLLEAMNETVKTPHFQELYTNKKFDISNSPASLIGSTLSGAISGRRTGSEKESVDTENDEYNNHGFLLVT